MDDIETFKQRLREFAATRNWDQFHSPKNLSMALIAEAAELVEHFQWLTEKESRELSPERLAEVQTELADIMIYLIRLADKLDIDLLRAVDEKIEINKKKYPVEKVHGSSKKYTEYKE